MLVAALGYMVDMYDLFLFSVVRVPSLVELGVTGDQLLPEGITLLNWQMAGLLIGGVLWGVLGDKRGRLSVLFGSIVMYSLANIGNGFVNSLEMYAVLRFIAGVGLGGGVGRGHHARDGGTSQRNQGLRNYPRCDIGRSGRNFGLLRG